MLAFPPVWLRWSAFVYAVLTMNGPDLLPIWVHLIADL
jgi:hypothetical protein